MATATTSSKLGRARAAAVLGSPGPSGVPDRRRWGRIGGGVAAAVAGMWIAGALVLSAGDRTDVVALADDVAQFEPIDRADLRIVRVAADEGVSTMPASELDAVVGRTAAVDLRSGTLLSLDHLVADGERLVQAGEAIVGARLAPGDAPLGDLSRGASVLVVVRPAVGQPGESRTVEGWLLDIGEADANTGDRSASLVVPRDDADVVATATGEKRVSIVALEE